MLYKHFGYRLSVEQAHAERKARLLAAASICVGLFLAGAYLLLKALGVL